MRVNNTGFVSPKDRWPSKCEPSVWHLVPPPLSGIYLRAQLFIRNLGSDMFELNHHRQGSQYYSKKIAQPYFQDCMVLKTSATSYEKSVLLVLLSSYQVVMFLTCISKVTSLNLCQNTSLCWMRFFKAFLSVFSQVLAQYLKLGHNQFLSNSWFITHTTIPHWTVWATDIIIK